MSSVALLGCDGLVSFTAEGAPLCSGSWVLQQAQLPFEISQLDPKMLSLAFSSGFVIVGSVVLAGWCARQLLNMIR